MKTKPSFYAIIPATVRYDDDLGSSEKLFYAEITAMSEKEGYCWASNGYFSELFGVSKNTITRWVSNLKNCGHVVVDIHRDGKQITKREIYPIQKNDDTYPQKSKGGTNKNDDTPTHKNGEENTTRYNTTSSNSYSQRIVNTVSDIEQIEDKNVILACHLWHDVNSLQPNNKTTQRAKVKTWAEPIRLMVEQDDRTYEEIWDLWKRVQKDEFWRTNILSPAKLRDKFDQLSIKLKPQKPQIDEQFIDSLF